MKTLDLKNSSTWSDSQARSNWGGSHKWRKLLRKRVSELLCLCCYKHKSDQVKHPGGEWMDGYMMYEEQWREKERIGILTLILQLMENCPPTDSFEL